MKAAPLIVCSACGTESILKREPRYEGFKKVGETLRCAACGHVYDREEEVPYKQRQAPKIFDETDRPRAVRVFSADEGGRTCRHCVHYVVNPFTQRCSLHKRTVEATDTCADFERKAEDPGTG